MLTIKPATLAEAYQLHLQIPEFKEQMALSKFEEELATTDKVQILIAHLNDKPIGYMISYDRFKDGSIYCWMTGVLPEGRGQGALTAMMNELIDWAKAKGFTEIKIKTRNALREMLSFLVKNNFNFYQIDQQADLRENRLLLSRQI